MANQGGFAGEKLRQYIFQIEQLEKEKTAIAEHLRDVFSEAKVQGFDTKTMRQVLKIRKLDVNKRQEQEMLLDTYLHALGMLPDFEKAA